MQTAWPTATLVHLPVHASWLNQVEIYFSVLQRKAINPVDFVDLDALAERIIAFQDRYNATATPFDWTFTRDDLNAFLAASTSPTPRTRRMTPDELTTVTIRSARRGGSTLPCGRRRGRARRRTRPPRPSPGRPSLRDR